MQSALSRPVTVGETKRQRCCFGLSWVGWRKGTWSSGLPCRRRARQLQQPEVLLIPHGVQYRHTARILGTYVPGSACPVRRLLLKPRSPCKTPTHGNYPRTLDARSAAWPPPPRRRKARCPPGHTPSSYPAASRAQRHLTTCRLASPPTPRPATSRFRSRSIVPALDRSIDKSRRILRIQPRRDVVGTL